MTDTDLDDYDRAVLDFEREVAADPTVGGEAEIRRRFDVDTTTYYTDLAQLIRLDEALEYDELTVRRLRRAAAGGQPRKNNRCDTDPIIRGRFPD